MFDGLLLILAFFAGILGTFIGGTQTFICTGFIGIVVAIVQASGGDISFLEPYILNGLFLPCIIFNGSVVATAVASHYNEKIRGFETGRSMAFIQDMRILLAGELAGVAGYLIYAVALYYDFPIDQGALSVVIIGVLARLVLNQEQFMNKSSLLFLKTRSINYWSYQLLFALAISFCMGVIVRYTGLYTIGFSISAFSLIFALIDGSFPAIHHITLVAGYAYWQTQSMVLCLIFGLLAHLIGLLFSYVFNLECGTHVDPPAVAIGSLSLVIFTLF